ncbi:MAG: hypothetical protein M3Z84_03045 [Actinomycetota bacterium]|nr:hypothetical protein [Actinomycetota bacterium]
MALGSVLLVGAGPAAPARVEQVVVLAIQHSRFSTGEMKFAPGTNVRFVVRNTDPIGHELIIGDATVQLSHELGTETQHAGRPGAVSVPPNTVAEMTYVFGAPGRLLFGCHLPGHWAYGMSGVIEVAA